MSTHGNIGIIHPDNRVEFIYIHLDAYLSHTGRILLKEYSSKNRVETLMSKGDLNWINFGGKTELLGVDEEPKSKVRTMDYVLNKTEEFLYLWDVSQNRWLWATHLPKETKILKPLTADSFKGQR